MDAFLWTMAATFFVSLLGLSGAATLIMSEDQTKKIIYVLTGFAVGTLLGGAFLHLLPEALGSDSADSVMLYAVVGFMTFFILEAYFHWHLCATEDCKESKGSRESPYSYLLLFGDAVHNFIDGLVIAGSFLVGVPFGLITTLLITAHEVPEELGIFALLVHGGLKRGKAILWCFLVQCTAFVGGIAGFFVASQVNAFVPALLAFAAGGFIYIAGSGLIPELHKETGMTKVTSMALVIVGLVFMWAVKALGGG